MAVTADETWEGIAKGEPVTVAGVAWQLHVPGLHDQRNRPRTCVGVRRVPQHVGEAIVSGRVPRSGQEEPVKAGHDELDYVTETTATLTALIGLAEGVDVYPAQGDEGDLH
jgi:hypothetical protein